MTRLMGRALALGALVVAVAAPAWLTYRADPVEAAAAAAGDAADPTTITAYAATFDLDAAGDLVVEERLSVSFPEYAARRGITRLWDRVDLADHGVRLEVRDLEVTRDGRPEPFEREAREHGRFDAVLIGAADLYVEPGLHEYVLRYRVPGVLRDGFDGAASSFDYDLLPATWAQGVAGATFTVRLPAGADAVQCGVGADRFPQACRSITGQGTDAVTVTTGPLAAHTPVRLRVGLDVPRPETEDRLWWSARWDVVLGRSVPALGVLAALAVLALTAGMVAVRRGRERPPSFPDVDEPPDGLGPAQGALLLTGRTDRTAYVASLLHAAGHGALRLKRTGHTWLVTDRSGADGWAGLDPVTGETAHLLWGPGSTFTADPDDAAVGERLATELDSFAARARSWALVSGAVVERRRVLPAALVVLAVALVAVAVVWNPLDLAATGLVPGAFAVAGLPLLRVGPATRRTDRGRELWAHVGGFRRTLATPSAQRPFGFAGREHLYAAHLPWAVALGCSRAWAEKYRAETGAAPPDLPYVAVWDPTRTAPTGPVDLVTDLDATLAGALARHEARPEVAPRSGVATAG